MPRVSLIKSLWKNQLYRYIAIAVILAVVFLLVADKQKSQQGELIIQKPIVEMTSAQQFTSGSALSLIGTARALTEAKVTAESAGRVVSVSVDLGDQITAGTIIATLENSSEQAAVLQAEGVYEAALAAAAQSEVGVSQAETGLRSAQDSAVSTFQAAYNTTNNIVRNTIDVFFTDPNSTLPGLRIDGKGFTGTLNSERVAYQAILTNWQQKSITVSASSDLESELQFAKEQTQRTILFIDTFLTVFASQDSISRYSDAELQTFVDDFTTARATLLREQVALDAALAALHSAEDSLARAQLASSGGRTSAADAQVKQALGALRAAEANYAKTIIRSPITGTVNDLSLKSGDFITAFSPVAVVANNAALEIITYVTEAERPLLATGDTVTIEDTFEGVITAIAPAVDSVTRKIEVRIATEAAGVVNGDTVQITKEIDSTRTSDDTVKIPLAAVKFERDKGYVLVVEDGIVAARPVVVGVVRGGSVEIREGLTRAEQFIADARGITVGTEVEVVK